MTALWWEKERCIWKYALRPEGIGFSVIVGRLYLILMAIGKLWRVWK